MKFVLQPWHLLLVILAGWTNREQQAVIEYLRTENQVLREKLGKKRILLSDDQRRRLAVKGKVLGRKMLEEVGTLFTPDTILRWHRMLVAEKWNYTQRRKAGGRPPISDEVVELVLRMARQNPTWGYDRIAGALANLGHAISDQSVGNILKQHGIEPAPDRKRMTTWSTFLKAHWDTLAAIDFTTIEVWTKGGLVTFYLLFAMELKSRRVHFAGCTVTPDDAWMKQIARNLTDAEDGFLNGKTHVLMDRDTKFSDAFRSMLEQCHVEPVRLPPRSPNLNAHQERFFRSLKSECLGRMIFFGEASLRNAVGQFLEHYHHERNHQGLENTIIVPATRLARLPGRSNAVNGWAGCCDTTIAPPHRISGSPASREIAVRAGTGPKIAPPPRTLAASRVASAETSGRSATEYQIANELFASFEYFDHTPYGVNSLRQSRA